MDQFLGGLASPARPPYSLTRAARATVCASLCPSSPRPGHRLRPTLPLAQGQRQHNTTERGRLTAHLFEVAMPDQRRPRQEATPCFLAAPVDDAGLYDGLRPDGVHGPTRPVGQVTCAPVALGRQGVPVAPGP
jgi:hypothetical protein